MIEIAANCPRCSRMFLLDCPPGGELPRHLDPLLGMPCPASGGPLASFLEVAGPEHLRLHGDLHVAWPAAPSDPLPEPLPEAIPDHAVGWPRWQHHRQRAPQGRN